MSLMVFQCHGDKISLKLWLGWRHAA